MHKISQCRLKKICETVMTHARIQKKTFQGGYLSLPKGDPMHNFSKLTTRVCNFFLKK